MEWLELAYNARGENLYEAMHNQTGYYGIKAPPTLNHRYIFEEIPMSLVPIASIGERYGVSVNCIRSIISLGCILHNTDYWRKGRTIEKLGIKDLSGSFYCQLFRIAWNVVKLCHAKSNGAAEQELLPQLSAYLRAEAWRAAFSRGREQRGGIKTAIQLSASGRR